MLWALGGLAYGWALTLSGESFAGAGHGTLLFAMAGLGPAGLGNYLWPVLWLFAALADLPVARITGWVMLAGFYVWMLLLFATDPSCGMDVTLPMIRKSPWYLLIWSSVFWSGQVVIVWGLIRVNKRFAKK
jgi:hypothetical protein